MQLMTIRPRTHRAHRINRLFGNACASEARPLARKAEARFEPAVDIFETGEKFIIEADLPGVSREDVDIDYRKRILTLSGERKTGEAKGRRSERPGGKFARRFVLPELIDTERIEAKFVCGVLRIEIPKPEESKTRKVTID